MGSNSTVAGIGEQGLVPEFPPRPTFGQRIQRARDLAATYSTASEILNFYARLALCQQHVFDCLRETVNADVMLSSDERWPLVTDVLLPHFPGFARSVSEFSPSPMSARALELALAGSAQQMHLLTSFWTNRLPEGEFASVTDRCIAMSFLQPYAELLAGLCEPPPVASSPGICPVCGSEPVCGVLRDRGHGAGRSLVCSLCMTEWSFLRAVCPACGENRFESLPVFTSENLPQVRIDACDTCLHYLKTVDMTKDGLATPAVDELAGVTLDLWARERGYRRLTRNLVGF